MASWFTRTLDTITPWNRRGEVQRRQERKKKEEPQPQQNRGTQAPTLRVTTAQPTQKLTVQGQTPKPQRPENLFQDLNKNLMIGKPKNALDVFKTQDSTPAVKPTPGTVVQPTLKVSTAPSNQRLKLPDGRYADEIPDTPETIINRGLDAGKSFEDIARENNYRLDGVREYANATRPNYGIKLEKPKQSLGNRIRDVFDANTEADKYRRYRGNVEKGEDKPINLVNPGNIVGRTPIVGHITKALNTLGTQGAQLIPTIGNQFATAELTAASEELLKAQKSGDQVRIAKAKQRVNDANNRVDDYERQQDAASTMFQKNKGGLFNTGTLYDEEGSRSGDIKTGLKDIVLPTAVAMADLYTLGKGNLISEGIKTGAPKVGVRTAVVNQAPNIGKATVGNFFSGAGSTVSEGGNASDAVKSGLLSSIFGIVPDVGLPTLARGFKTRVMPKFMRTGTVAAGDVVDELDDAAISASAEAVNQALKPRPIKVVSPVDIPVKITEGVPENIPVKTPPKPQPQLIKEIEGDFNFPTFEQLQEIRVADMKKAADEFNSAARPDPMVEGISTRKVEPYKLNDMAVKNSQDELIDEYAAFLKDVGEGNGTQLVPDGQGGYFRTSNNVRFGDTKGKRMTKQMWRDEAERQLRAGEAEGGIQKQFDEAADPEIQSMLDAGEQPDAPIGRPIQVKEVKGIPVRDETVVPTDSPETPGQVRVTEAKEPMKDKTQAVADTQTVYTEASQSRIPVVRDTANEYILNNPKQFTKRQVAAARNQRKLARQLAKTQEDTVAAMERINESSPKRVAGQSDGYAPTGEFGRGKRGNAYEKASNEAEDIAGRREMELRSVDDLVSELGTKESFTPGDRRRLQAAIENMAKAEPDNIEIRTILRKLQSKSRTELGQGLALIPRVIRRSASADTLVNRWESKIARALDNPAKMSKNDLLEVQRANDAFTLARDRAAQLEEQFKRTGDEADFNAWKSAFEAARKADVDAKFTEASVAKRVLKGEKGAHVTKVLDDLKKESDVNTMDIVTANMLSGTATGFRNTFGTELAGVENRLFANTRAKITNKLFGENVGGYNRQGARLGRKIGLVKFGRDAARRAEIGGKNPLEWVKNWSTTINSAGESSLQSQVYSRLGKYYQNQFKAQGLTGKELDMRMQHSMLTDPDNMAETYLDAAMKSSGLSGLFEKGQTIERAVVDLVGKKSDSKVVQNATRLLMRLTLGFPTATANFLYQSTKRLTLGFPSYVEMGVKLGKGDKLGAAQAFDRALKEGGSGAAVLGLGAALGQAGMISGPYPSDPDERARWEREGISENSIKIGGAWYPIPQGAGMLGLPLMTGAALGRDGVEGVAEMYNPKNFSKLLPTDQVQGFLNMASGNGAPQDFKNFVASTVRAVTPAGALLNQIAKSTDSTKNDTTTKSLGMNIVDQIMGGIPVANNFMDIPDKKDDAGNVINNPNPLQLAFGATSASQGKGEQRSAEISAQIDSSLQNIADTGAFSDSNLKGVLDNETAQLYNKVVAGEKIDESDLRKLQDGLVNGVSKTGEDTAYLEKGQYETNLTALRLKKQLMEADNTTKPSDIKKMDIAIKRGEIYRDGEVPYDLIDAYQNTGVDEWRKMGDPEDEDYDPEMYQKLWALDERMTKNGVSYRKGALDKQKYYAKTKTSRSGSGSRSSGGGGSAKESVVTDFGKLKSGDFAPSVQAYQTIDQKSGSVPVIRTVRPNIVHNIGSSR